MVVVTFERFASQYRHTQHRPSSTFIAPPMVLANITTNAIDLVHRSPSDCVLAIDLITEYYYMKLATFGVDFDGNMIVAFPVFVKDLTSKPKTLYEIEMVKVTIPSHNKAADSYSEVRYSKPYLAINDDYYIQL